MCEKSKFIDFEGIDGVGKTTLAKKVCDKLNELGYKAFYLNRKQFKTTSNYLNMHMGSIANILWSDGEIFKMADNEPYNGINIKHWLYLIQAWYSCFECNMVDMVVKENDIVISDGYFFKEMAKFKVSMKDDDITKFFNDLKRPDVVIYLKSNPNECIATKSYISKVENGSFDGENSDYLHHQSRLSEAYDQMALDNSWKVINRKDNFIENNVEEILKIIGVN